MKQLNAQLIGFTSFGSMMKYTGGAYNKQLIHERLK